MTMFLATGGDVFLDSALFEKKAEGTGVLVALLVRFEHDGKSIITEMNEYLDETDKAVVLGLTGKAMAEMVKREKRGAEAES
jgi:hypothetical protein